MTKRKWLRGLGISVVVVLACIAGIYTYFNGTFWAKASAEKQMKTSLNQQFSNVNFHQLGGSYYNFKTSSYGMTVVFNKLPSVRYFYELHHGKLVYEGNSAIGPDPIPYQATWLGQDVQFKQGVLQQIKDKMASVNVPKGTYILTGGLGMGSPIVQSADSQGGLTLQSPGTGYVFTFTQNVPNPANWRVLSHSSNSVNVAEQGTGGAPVPWVKKETTAGQTYYEWDVYSGFTWFYFQKVGTYFVLKVSSPGVGTYPFPENIMGDLELLGSSNG